MSKIIASIFLICPFVIAGLWTMAPAMQGVYASYSILLSQDDVDYAVMSEDDTKLRRNIQKFFLKYHVYIPFDDIVVVHKNIKDKDKIKMLKMTKNLCGDGKIYVWVPLRFRMPIIGDRILEWCITPKVSKK